MFENLYYYGYDSILLISVVFVDVVSNIVSAIVGKIAEKLLGFIPIGGFFIGFIMGYVINEVCSLIFNEKVKDRVAVHCANTFPRDSKGISSCWLYIKIFFTGLLQSIR